MKANPVVITGAGMVTSLGRSRSETWNALLAGRCGVGPIQGFDCAGFSCRVAAQVLNLNRSDSDLQSRHETIFDLHSYMLLRSARDAHQEAGLTSGFFAAEDVGFFVGMGMVDHDLEQIMPAVAHSVDGAGHFDSDAFYAGAFQEIHPLFGLSLLNNVSFCQAAIELHIHGENAVYSPHADSGAQAIAEGVRAVAEGNARAVLAGGVSEKITPQSLARAHLQGVLSVEKDSQAPGCRPFAAERSGTVLGEGCGVLCLEGRASADRRGVSYGVAITGYGAAFGSHADAMVSAEAIACAMEKALEDAKLCASDIDVVIAHGEGTWAGDGNEIEAIQRVFASCNERLRLFSSKGALGHILAGAPAVDAILAESILREQVLPSTSYSEPADPRVGFRLSSRAQKISASKILLNCRSSEGQCASLVFETVS